MAAPFGDFAFSAGELAPSLWGRVDIDRFHIGAATMRNMFVGYRGGAVSRAGTAFVGMSKQNPNNGQVAPRLVRFNFSISQQYMVEFGDNYARFVANGGYLVENGKTISGATQANPCVLTATAHGFSNGDWVVLSGVGGMVQLNGNTYVVANVTTNTFSLNTTDGNAVDSTAYGAYTSGGAASRIYTIVSPYSGSDLAQLKFTQSADVMTIAHPSYPVYNLSRSGQLSWSLSAASIGSTVAAPGSCTVTATTQPNSGFTPPTLPAAYAYVVTAVNSSGQESQASPVGNVTNGVDMAATAGSNIVTWSPVAGASYYKVYRAPTSYNTKSGSTTAANPVPVGAIFGLVGPAFGTQLVDDNDTPDYTNTPPLHQNPLAPGQILAVTVTGSTGTWSTATISITTSTGSGFVGEVVIVNSAIVAVVVVNPGTGYLASDTPVFSGDGSGATGTLSVSPATGSYPSVVAYFQQRRVYANSLNSPDTYWMSQPGQFNNFDASIPTIESDAITGTPWSEQVDGVQFLQEMPLGLIAFTGSAVYTVQASGTSIFAPSAISPSNQQALPQSSIGSSSTLAPVRDNWDLLYFEPDNATVRDLAYQLYFNLYTGVDVTWQSAHLTLGHQIVDRAWCRKPNYLLWMARDDGILLSLTFMKEQQVTGWARHTTQGQVRTLCSVTELPVDALYLCVQRPVAAGGTRYFIERMDNRIWFGVEDSWCVDCGIGTTPPTPSAALGASAASGNGITFTASANVFSNASVGQTIRMGGGVALVTGYTDAQHVTGNWCYPCQQTVPDDPSNTPLTQGAGAWSLAPQITTIRLPYQLASKQVVGVADGVPVGPLTVDSTGLVTLPFPASNVKVGLAFTAQLQSMYLATGSQPTDQGRRKSIGAVTIRCDGSSPMQAGANENDTSAQYPPPLASQWATGLGSLPALPAQLPATYTSPGGQTVQPLFTGDARIPIPSGWKKPGQVAAQQTLPLPMNVSAFVLEGLDGDLPETTYTQASQPARGPGRRAA